MAWGYGLAFPHERGTDCDDVAMHNGGLAGYGFPFYRSTHIVGFCLLGRRGLPLMQLGSFLYTQLEVVVLRWQLKWSLSVFSDCASLIT